MDLNSSQIGPGVRPGEAYEFGEFRIDPARRTLMRGTALLQLTSKAFETLLTLIERADRVVSKEELMKVLWPKTVVEEANLSQNIFVVRKALGESAQEPRFIVTVPGVGYRFAGAVRVEAEDSAAAAAASPRLATPEGAAHSVTGTPASDGASAVAMELPALAPAPTTARASIGWRTGRNPWLLAGATVVAVLVAVVLVRFTSLWRGPAAQPAVAGRIVLSEIVNRTGDSVFDRTLREALAIDLAQSRYLTVLSDEAQRATLRLMNRASGEPLVREAALEVCRRRGLDAVLDGSIARLGNEYVLTLEAIGCGEGERVASTQARADSKEHTLDAMSRATAIMRARLGESLTSIRNSSRPLREVTTSSLEALQAFTTGAETMRHAPDSSAGIPFFERAIERDPTFASAYAYLSILYMQLGETERAAELQSKAYALRDRVSERERYLITGFYHFMVTGDLDRETATYELWIARYPHDWVPRANLVDVYLSVLGNYPKALELARECDRIEPDQPYCAETIAAAHLGMNEVAPARAVLEQAVARKLDYPMLHAALYRVAAFQRDEALADAQRSWSAQQPVQDDLGWMFANQMAQGGQLKQFQAAMRAHARELSATGFKEAAAADLAVLALTEVEYGDAHASVTDAAASLALSRGRDVLCQLAIAYALAGHADKAMALLDELDKRFPHYSSALRVYVPLTRALLLARDGHVAEALETLEPLRRYDMGRSWAFLPLYVRGLLLLQKGDGAAAEREFQTIIQQRGVATFAPEWALAHLGAARAAALTDLREQSQMGYQRFFQLWQSADADIPINQQAHEEFARLK